MTLPDVMAALTVLAALAAGAAGLCAHLLWLAVSDPRELLSVVAMFWEVIAG